MSGVVTQNVGRPSGLVKAAAAAGGAWTEIKSVTASCDATISFVDGTDDVTLDDTYAIYCFKFINIHPETDGVNLQFQANVAGGADYNETITSTHFTAYHLEDDSGTNLSYQTGDDQCNGTGFQTIAESVGSDNDQNVSGYLYIFDPGQTTFTKNFISRVVPTRHSDSLSDEYGAGHIVAAAAMDEFQFKMSSGDIDAGKIKLFGLKDS